MPTQSAYQVRFEWGAPGVDSVGDGADAVIWVDQLPATPRDVPDFPTVVAGSIQNRRAVAAWVIDEQARVGDRFTVAVIAAGEARADGSLRVAVEDLLGARAVIDALAAGPGIARLAGVGIDYCSPEAAAACAAFTSLSKAAAHLISASESGMATGRPMLDLDAIDEVPRLR